MEKQSSNELGSQIVSISHPEVAVVMVPLPAQGHLNQLLHLSHILASHGLTVHYATSTTHNHQAKLRLHGRESEITSKIHFHEFELPPYSTPPLNLEERYPEHLLPLFDVCPKLREPVAKLLQNLSTKFRRVVVIHDSLMGSVVQDAKFISNAEAYTFAPTAAFTMFAGAWEYFPEKPFQLDNDDVPKSVPTQEGCIPPGVMNFIMNQQVFLDFQVGILYNTSRVVEGKYVKLLEMLLAHQKHFAIGPFNPVAITTTREKQENECLEWLDRQENDSVLFISFGSTTSMTDEQIQELAIGLEKSGQKFIWVLRRADEGNVFAEGDARRPQLPEGYEKRLKGRGLVVTDWAPQLDILAHPSTGAFMSHCGWNSCLESITMGVPVAAWPMHSDQPRNSALFTEVLKTGVLVRDWADRDQLITSDKIESAVRRLMISDEGQEIRKRAENLSKTVRDSTAEGGASHSEMESFIAHITR